MSGKMKSIIKIFDHFIDRTGRVLSLLIFIMMFMTTIEAVARYAFNHPTMWVWPLNRQLFAVFILMAGVYTMSKGDHIRVEILYDFLPPRLRMFAKWLAFGCFLIFMITLVLQGAKMGWMSFKVREVQSGAFAIPLYPLKLLIPIAAFLFLLEGLVVFFRRKNDKKS